MKNKINVGNVFLGYMYSFLIVCIVFLTLDFVFSNDHLEISSILIISFALFYSYREAKKEKNTKEFCLLCGDAVYSNNWREHMRTKHGLVCDKPIKDIMTKTGAL